MSWERLSELFVGALARPAGERDRWLEDQCPDRAMRAEVAAMVRAHERAGREPLAIERWLRDEAPVTAPPPPRRGKVERRRQIAVVAAAVAALSVAGLVGFGQARRAALDREAGARVVEDDVEPAPPPAPQPLAPEVSGAAAAPSVASGGAHQGAGDAARAQAASERAPGPPAPPAPAAEGSRPEAPEPADAIAAAKEHSRRQEEALRRRLSAATASQGAESIVAANAWHALGTSLALQGRLEEADSAFTTALGLFERRLGAEHPAVAGALRDLGRVRHLQGRPHEALPLLHRALAIAERRGGERPQAPVRSVLRAQHARVAWLLERTPAALERMRSAAAEILALDGPEAERRHGDALTLLGMTLVEANRACEAVSVLRDGLVRRESTTAPAPGPALETRCALRDAERACGTASREGLAECARDLPRWGLADPELLRRLEPGAASGR